jgi:hypothetical protein
MRAFNAQRAMEKRKIKQGQYSKGKKLEHLEGRSDNRGRKPMALWSSPQTRSEENRKL